MKGLVFLAIMAALAASCLVMAEPKEFWEDNIILGGGVSALQLGYYMKRGNRPYLILERTSDVASIFRKYPRHDKLISINKRFTGRTNKEFNLRHDWNSLVSDDSTLRFGLYTDVYFPHRSFMVKYLEDFQRKLEIGPFRFNTEISNVRPVWNETLGRNTFVMNDQHGNTFRCRNLVIATGLFKPIAPIFEGMEFVEGYEDIPTDPDNYTGQSVIVLGNGNAGFEVAQSVIPRAKLVHMVGRSRIKMAFHTHYLGNLRATNLELLDNYLLKSLGGILEINIEKVKFLKEPDGKVYFYPAAPELKKVFQGVDYPIRFGYDRIIRCLGFKFDTSVFAPDVPFSFDVVKNKYPSINHNYESTTIPDLFYAGTIVHSLDIKKASGGFIAGIRYTTRALYNLLEWRNYGKKWPSSGLQPMSNLLPKTMHRFSETSGMWHMAGFFGDIVLIRNGGKNFEYLEEFPTHLVHELYKHSGHEIGPEGVIVQILQFGRNFTGEIADTMRVGRNRFQASTAYEAVLLHPSFYYYPTLPTKAEFDARNVYQILPRPVRLHYLTDDPHQQWDAPHRHILNTRRYLELVMGNDQRWYYGEDCLTMSLTHKDLPLSCQMDVLNQPHIVGRLSK